MLGAAVIIVGDRNPERLAHAKKMGYETVDICKHDKLGEQIAQILGEPWWMPRWMLWASRRAVMDPRRSCTGSGAQ